MLQPTEMHHRKTRATVCEQIFSAESNLSAKQLESLNLKFSVNLIEDGDKLNSLLACLCSSKQFTDYGSGYSLTPNPVFKLKSRVCNLTAMLSMCSSKRTNSKSN